MGKFLILLIPTKSILDPDTGSKLALDRLHSSECVGKTLVPWATMYLSHYTINNLFN